ncbi:MAG: hypothetical protein GF409_03315 [Candidatus Omnitrophica bacterium]|nr:hypothetical protein [Candidatus Omnitrophota bacterium]
MMTGTIFKKCCVLSFLLVCLFFSVQAEARQRWVKSKTGLGTLIQLGKDRAEMEKNFTEETSSYESLKKAIDEGDLEKGTSAKRIRGRYGEPVVTFSLASGEGSQWVYKPGTQNFLDGADKVYLEFDKEGNLQDWKSVKRKEKNEKPE